MTSPAGALAEEITHLAASIPRPVDAFGVARAYCICDHEPGSRLTAGYAARLGGRTTFRVVFATEGGRRHSDPVGPPFERPSSAVGLAVLINGGSAAFPVEDRDGITTAVCIVCAGTLPAGSRPHRQTCSSACRQRLARHAGAAKQGSRESKARGSGSVRPAAVSAGPSPPRRKPAREPAAPSARARDRSPSVLSARSPQGTRCSEAGPVQLDLSLIQNTTMGAALPARWSR